MSVAGRAHPGGGNCGGKGTHGVHSRARPVQRGSGYTEVRPARGGRRYGEALKAQSDSGPIVNAEMKFSCECLSVFQL